MCKPCKQKHDKVAIFKNHNVEEIKMSQETSNVCPTHHQSISYICQKCLKGICMDCLMADEHVDHQDRVEDMGAGIKTLRNSVTEISKVRTCRLSLTCFCNSDFMNERLDIVLKTRFLFQKALALKKNSTLKATMLVVCLNRLLLQINHGLLPFI